MATWLLVFLGLVCLAEQSASASISQHHAEDKLKDVMVLPEPNTRNALLPADAMNQVMPLHPDAPAPPSSVPSTPASHQKLAPTTEHVDPAASVLLEPPQPTSNSQSPKTNQPASSTPSTHTEPAGVSRIFFINLDSRPDRLAWIQTQLAISAPHIPNIRFSAIKTAGYEDAKHNPQFSDILKDWPVSTGIVTGQQHNGHFAVSVFLSHITLYKKIISNKMYDSPQDLVMILEDDVELVPDWSQKLTESLKSVPKDWEILRIGHWGQTRDEDLVAPGVFAARGPFWVEPATAYYGGAHAVVMRVENIPKVIEHLHQVSIGDVDGMMTSCCDLLKSYVLEDQLASVVENGSDNPDHV